MNRDRSDKKRTRWWSILYNFVIRYVKVELDEYIEKENDGINKNFVGFFLSNVINCFINFHNLMKRKNAAYPFMIMNTDRSDKKETHWWSMLDPHPQKQFFFQTVLILKFKNIYYTRQEKIINKILFGIRKFKKKIILLVLFH